MTGDKAAITHDMSPLLYIADRYSKNNYLIDTGAVVSVVPVTNEKQHPTKSSLLAANGTPITVYGEKLISVNLGLRRQFDWVFIIADVRHAIIGADFLQHFQLLVDISGKRLLDNDTKLSTYGEIRHTPNAERILCISCPKSGDRKTR